MGELLKINPYKMKRAIYFTCLLLGIGSLLSFQAYRADQRPNFIFIAIDDLNNFNSVLGNIPESFLEKIYPEPKVRAAVLNRMTPNLQRFARQALTFERAYCAYPLCGPSRTALLTGVPPHLSGYVAHDRHFRHYETLAKVQTLPQYLRQQGYYTVGLGKVFHKPIALFEKGYFSDWPDRLYSWSDWIEVHAGTGSATVEDLRSAETLSKYWSAEENKNQQFTRFGTTTLPLEQSNDFLNAQFAANLIVEGKASKVDIHKENREIRLPEDKPYFLACGLFAPHAPWIARPEFYQRFPQSEMQINRALLQWVQQDLQDLSPSGKAATAQTSFSKLINYGRHLDGENGDLNAWKAALQAYLATIAYSDHCLGQLLNAIEKNPRKDNTIVVLWSDHGYHLGDKNREGKVSLWEAANRCNLMIFDPRQPGASIGKRSQSLVSLQDVYPSIVALAGLNLPKHVHGHDLSPILQNPSAEGADYVINTFDKFSHAIRTRQYRYIRFKNGDQELYDLIKDPFEVKNLADDANFSEVLKQLKTQLDQVLAQGPAATK